MQEYFATRRWEGRPGRRAPIGIENRLPLHISCNWRLKPEFSCSEHGCIQVLCCTAWGTLSSQDGAVIGRDARAKKKRDQNQGNMQLPSTGWKFQLKARYGKDLDISRLEEISTGDIGSLSRNKCLQVTPQLLWYNTVDLWGGSSLS